MTTPQQTDHGTPTGGQRPGLRRMIAGGIVMLLAPLFGFLGGTMTGFGPNLSGYQPMYLWLFGGMLLGSVGALVAITGALAFFAYVRGGARRLP